MKYRQTRKPKYQPLTRFTFARSPQDFPPKVRRLLSRKDVKFGFVSECPFCEKESMIVFHVEDPENPGNFYVCGNPECGKYAEVEWYPLKGGR
ncbi:MAG: hypothetical protein QXL06_06505 [Nitrososphaerota archaeon]